MTGGCVSPEVCGKTAVCLLQLEDSVHCVCVCVCLGKQQQQSRGLWETAIKANAVPPVKQVDGAGRLLWPAAISSKALSQSRDDAWRPEPHGLCFSTAKRDNGLAFDISV